MGFAAAIQKLFEAISSVFDYKNTAKAHQSETDVIKTKRDLKKATNYGELIVMLIESDNCTLMFKNPRTKRRYQNLKKKFMGCN